MDVALLSLYEYVHVELRRIPTVLALLYVPLMISLG
jgi:hypothetical protein